MKKLILFVWFCCYFLCYSSAEDRNLLEKNISKKELSNVLAKGTDWVDFPKYSDRSAWGNIAPEIKQAIISQGEESLNFQWGIIKATDYVEFTRSGNRDIMQNPDSKRTKALTNLALAELIEGKGRFVDQIINGVWAICEQSTWVLSAHLPSQKGGAGLPNPDDITIDLGSARTGALIAWIHYYFKEEFNKVSPFITKIISREIENRILVPYYSRSDFWWMGFNTKFVNNWNVWINYNVLQCILLMESDQQKRIDNVYKVMQSIDQFINYYKEDGGCDEGPSYWDHAGGKFFEDLELLYKASGGRINIYQNELVKNIGRYIYRAYISDPYFVNFADASAKGGINPGLVYRYGKAIDDPIMKGFGSFYAQKEQLDKKVPGGTFETIIHDLLETSEIINSKAIEPLLLECWLPESQFVVARDKEDSKSGFFFAAKGGHNQESHNHNDVGTCILYYNGLPVLIDVGVGTYTRQTFSSERYSIWTMQSGYHNLPVINGQDQSFGLKYAAKNVSFKSSRKIVDFSVDLTAAYQKNSEVKEWIRSYSLSRGKFFSISDQYSLFENKGNSSLHFMTACKTSILQPGTILLEGNGFSLKLTYNSNKLTAKIENIKVEDPRLQKAWGNQVTRLLFDFKDTSLSGNNTIIIKQ